MNNDLDKCMSEKHFNTAVESAERQRIPDTASQGLLWAAECIQQLELKVSEYEYPLREKNYVKVPIEVWENKLGYIQQLERERDAITIKYDCAIVQDKLKAESIADLKERIHKRYDLAASASGGYSLQESEYGNWVTWGEHYRLVEAAREYSYNEHAQDCKITRYTNPVCSCGLVELEALLTKRGDV